jgi:hypothetical protein
MKRRFNYDELFTVADSYLRESFPNPDRIGCPSANALQTAATMPRNADPSVIEHISYCSACYCEYADSLHRVMTTASQAKSHKRRWTQLAWAIVACSLAVAIVTAIYWRHSVSHSTTAATAEQHAIQAGSTSTNTPYTSVLVDLSQASPRRGATDNGHALAQISLPASRANVAIRLPLGSDEGTYAISLLTTTNRVVWSARAQAKLENHQVIIHTQADLTRVPPGQHQLDIKSTANTHIHHIVSVTNTNLPSSHYPQ